MNYLSVENLTKSFGVRVLFEDLTFGIDKGDKVAIVAKNGQGKSTLLKILCDLEDKDSGKVVYRKDIRVDYLQQDENFDPDLTIIDEVLSTDTPESQAILAYEKAMLDLEDMDKYNVALEMMNDANAWDYEVKANQILSQLQLFDKTLKIGTLSGGQKKRLALAKLLISEPDIMILDEPTNHLDLDMIEWLETFLSQSNSTIIMVTHDRYFLEVICNTIYELEDQTIYKYNGNFSYYLEKKAERQEILAATIGKAKNLMSTELEWIRRQPKARGTKQKARVDAFAGIKEVATQKVQEDQLEIEIEMSRLGSKVVEIHKLQKSFGDKIIIDQMDYVFKRGEKLGIVGKNGAGKSTFLNMLVGKELPTSGKISVGETIVMGYYHQDGLKFDEQKKVIDIIKDIAEFIPLTKGRRYSAAQFLEMFMFPKDMHYNFVYKLSGGEKKRLYLMTILMKNPNFLILDEPTNDLDIFTLSVLEAYLTDFKGCLIVVSHDRYFMDKMVEHTFYFEGDGKIKDVLGNYTDYRAYLKAQESADKLKGKASADKKVAIAEVPVANTATTNTDTKRKLTYKEKQEFNTIEKELSDLNDENTSILEKMTAGVDDAEEMKQLSIRMTEIAQLIESKENRWLELSEIEG
ncbi:ABC transporter ATP-binding protein [Putridiphycobacter roseus]|uniref:ABC transporter ATP-binding protein n=1 Tax=Putridiphycobacter roseus TaxID=2219161 RepID=A0A2W1NLG5_9FLAO|nr:ABC-F family ATP-binding cassette domain-containing protein [Putridiphycobacter roseus]PZE16502.1 ABC transporter ATP-binding protein [Putridiphycobacter roseus]